LPGNHEQRYLAHQQQTPTLPQQSPETGLGG
jgi:hypothetical protein